VSYRTFILLGNKIT